MLLDKGLVVAAFLVAILRQGEKAALVAVAEGGQETGFLSIM